MTPQFENRTQAGLALAQALIKYRGRTDLLVLGLPRGGVPVAYQVAKTLQAPLDVIVVRKLGLPSQPELAMGAIASGGVRVLNEDVIGPAQIDSSLIEMVTKQELVELSRREELCRGKATPLSPFSRCVLLIDDGLATGATMRAAIAAIRKQHPSRIAVGVPVAAPQTCETIRPLADELVCVSSPDPFHAVGLWYEDFEQTTDAEIRELLLRSNL